MIKHLFIALICFLSIRVSYAQSYGNEWIRFTQPYFKISIPKTGLYRIDSATIANAGIPLNTVTPHNLQIFIKGEEQYIYINGDADGVFNGSDYLEFYAEKNDGRFDSISYTGISRLPNPYIALYNDTNYAYLSYNNLITNRRVIIENDLNFTGFTASPYFYTERVLEGKNTYATGRYVPPGIYDPRYITGEGYGDGMAKGTTIQTAFTTANIYQSPTLPVYIKTSFSGNSDYSILGSTYDHEITTEYLNSSNNFVLLNDTMFQGHQHVIKDYQLSSDQLQNTSVVRISSINNPVFNTINNQSAVHYISVKYPQIPTLSGASEHTFWLDDSPSFLKSYLDIQNVASSSSVVLYDLTNHRYILVSLNGTNVKALIPNSGGQKKCYLTSVSNITHITTLHPVGQNGFFTNYKQNNPDSAYIIITHKSLQVSANAYKQYRESSDGGSNSVILAYIDELYDQYAYGNTKNPLAIKNFCRFLSDSLPTPPSYLLLLGKSVKSELVRNSAANWNACLVPTMGSPASDNMLTAGIHGMNNATPFIPLGRVSAKNDVEATNYLDKVKSHESALTGIRKPVPDAWRKNVLHFAGGSDQFQQNLFTSYLNNYANIITDTLYGGKVFYFGKTTTAPIQLTISDSVKSLITNGASLITFFGHGSTNGFDQAIDDPNAYSNKDKYPVFLANSCYSGDVHLPGIMSASENFTLIKDKGSIAFLASASTGVVNPLYYYSDFIYQSFGYETYYKGVGDAAKNACYKGYTSVADNGLQQITGLDMTLEGDPYVRINAYSKPDYMINNASVSLNASSLDSVNINIFIRNNGKAINDTFIVRVERYFPNGDSTTFFKAVKAPMNNTTLRFNIHKDFERGIGLNHFRVFIDCYNAVIELSETNNSTTGNVDLFIPGGDVIPVYPYKYAVIPTAPQVTLKASTVDPFATNANYRLQLDTNDTFQNPINSTMINSNGGVIEWTVNLPYGDSTVYFWRVTKDSVSTTDRINWKESSFQTINNKHGWSQAHFHQFKNDGYQFVKYRKAIRRFEYENDIASLFCRDRFLSTSADFDQIVYSVNNSVLHIYSCAPGGWSIVIFDSISAQPRTSQSLIAPSAGPGPYNNCHCDGLRKLYAFDFGSSNACGFTGWQWQNELYNLLNSLPVNTKVLAYSQQNHHASTFSNALYTEFEKLGSANIRSVTDTVPIIIFGKKTATPLIGSAHEVVGLNNKSIITLDDSIKTNWSNGYIASEIIGPSAKWNSLHWQQISLETPNKDSVYLKLVGIKTNGLRDTIPVVFPSDSTDVLDLYNYVDASVYPYLQMIAFMKDDVYKTPSQLKRWQVLYDEVPECALNPKKGFTINDTIQQGEKLIVHIPIENIGALPFNDSLVVTYWFEDQNKISHRLPQKLKASPFVPAQLIIDTLGLDSTGFTGLSYLWVDVNPPGNIKYQKEQYHINNIARIPFFVSADKINPLLDVTFDGTHILNGDIISAKPHVLITLKDENKFLALNDTTNFAVFIRYPNQSTEKRLSFANSSLLFTPAHLPSNSCKIEWNPEFAEDGKYRLIVQATDRSKNASGAVDYTIDFEIITKQTVTEVLNYPNPFSTSTRFVFTLTGSEVPDVFIIQIMTITGKVVKEITKNDLGNLHIGRNITSYTWDGRDEFGDKLGNGVYLYKVITRHNGQAVEKKQTDADSFFKKGFGKLVIMR